MTLLPNNKKSDQLKILSETEIQSKLYGKYRKPHLAETEGPSSFRKSQVNPTVSDESSIDQQELFQNSSVHKEAQQDKSDRRPIEGNKIESYIQRENKYVQKSTPEYKSGQVAVSQPKKTFNFQKYVGILKTVAVAVGAYATAAVSKIVSLLVSLFDVKKAGSRKMLIIFGAAFFLVMSLVAINWLNMKRDKAMKSPKKVLKLEAEIPNTVTEVKQDTASGIPSAKIVAPKEKVKLGSDTPQAAVAEGSLVSGLPAGVRALPKPSVPGEVKPYAIQVATYINSADAKKMADDLTRDGFPSFVEGLSRQSGRVYHCVFIGRFKTFSDAEHQLSEFKKRPIAKPFQDAFIRALNQG